jgi:hypothetical protein
MHQFIGLQRFFTSIFVVGLLAAGLAGCGQDPDSRAPSALEESTVAAASPATKAVPRRDLSTFDVCALLPVAAVAKVLTSTPDRVSAEATMRSYSTDCTYTIDRGEGMKDYAIVYLYSHEMWAPVVEAGIEKIAGLGDDAYLTASGGGSFDTVHVLVKGDFMLDTRAISAEQARSLAELVLARLAEVGG